jgi:hypothetical protein
MPGAEIEPKQDTKPKQDTQQLTQDELVSDIERTRENLARTIDAISDRVSPANIARRTADRARERVAAIDPVVAGGAVIVVAGVTVAWLLLRRRKKLSGSRASPRSWSGRRTARRTAGRTGARRCRAGP